MPDQLTLSLVERKAPITAEMIDQVCRALQGQGWLDRETLAARCGLKVRQVRRAAEYSGGRILGSPGIEGYHLTIDASIDDINRACSALESQIKRMQSRVLDYRRLAHAVIARRAS